MSQSTLLVSIVDALDIREQQRSKLNNFLQRLSVVGRHKNLPRRRIRHLPGRHMRLAHTALAVLLAAMLATMQHRFRARRLVAVPPPARLLKAVRVLWWRRAMGGSGRDGRNGRWDEGGEAVEVGGDWY